MTKQPEQSFVVSYEIESVFGDVLCNTGKRLKKIEDGKLQTIVIHAIQSVRVTEDGRHIIIKGTYRTLGG